MNLRSFAMLLPCGISLFAGVEFVCCPKHLKENVKPRKHLDLTITKSIDVEVEDELADEDDLNEDTEVDSDTSAGANVEDVLNNQTDDMDSEADYLEDDDTTIRQPSTTSSTTEKSRKNGTSMSFPASTSPLSSEIQGTLDPYITHFDPRLEHQSYKQAQMRLEEVHKEKVTKVMKDWSDLEERYQDIRARDPVKADQFKRWMTKKFQETVSALEASGAAEKRQLSAMHQERVQEAVKQRNEEAMSCYTSALDETPSNVHRIQKCLQKLLRALHKDRHHTIAHYKHLLDSSIEQANQERISTLEHLAEINRIANQSILMLERFPELSAKIGQLMDNYVLALRSKDETPGLLLAMSMEEETAILDKYQADVASAQQEKEHQKQLERERKKQRKAERGELLEEQEQRGKVEPVVQEKEVLRTTKKQSAEAAAMQREAIAKVSHSMNHEVSHSEPSYSVRRDVYDGESRSAYFTLAFAGIALMAATIVGVAVFKRRSAGSPYNQGFIEVDQAATPEERHVVNMQINGYENPTYKYFEVKE